MIEFAPPLMENGNLSLYKPVFEKKNPKGWLARMFFYTPVQYLFVMRITSYRTISEINVI